MHYLKCPSCNYLLGNRQVFYEKELEIIESDNNTTESQKLDLKKKLVEKLELPRYCCRMRVMTFKSKTTIFK